MTTSSGVAEGVEAGWTVGAECVGDCDDLEVEAGWWGCCCC